MPPNRPPEYPSPMADVIGLLRLTLDGLGLPPGDLERLLDRMEVRR